MNTAGSFNEWIPGLDRLPRLLVVDDQPLIIRVLNEIFKNECQVSMATDSRRVIEICRKQQPDLILLDIMMPGIDGYTVCRQLKADAMTADIPVIFVSSQQEVENELRGFDVGAVDFITKPVNPVLVYARVRTHIAVKIQRDLLRASALQDGLTGVSNRRRFEETLELNWKQDLREQRELSLIMVDLDYFKRYNDYYGHLEGDQCLIRVAQTIKAVLKRPSDSLSRYGGEEFVCLLPDTNQQGAKKVASNILRSIETLAIPHVESPLASQVSVSLGGATVKPNLAMNRADLIKAADIQLYQAKQQGRGRYMGVQLSADAAGTDCQTTGHDT
tara:strand:- start:1391 stop:2383 length:993 start_codon:yes stop_codon:yes gene_type:complete